MTRKSSSRVRIYAVMGLVGCYFAFPIVFMFMSALKDRNAILSDARSIWAFLPVGDIGFENFRYVLFETSFIYSLANSLLISMIMVGAGVIALLIIPFGAIAIPLLVLVSKLPAFGFSGGWPVLGWGWFNTHHVQIIPFIGHAFSVYLFYQFFRDILREPDEAATVDGATPWDIYWRIVIPNAKPIISTVAIILLMAMWNQYLWPVMPGIQIFFGRTVEWGQIMAYAALITLPILVLFLMFQRQFVQSVVGSGIKG